MRLAQRTFLVFVHASATRQTPAASLGVSSVNGRVGSITLLSSDVTTALGYTPYDATNPNSYTTLSAVAGVGYLLNGGALGTPSSGTLVNCTFPILNQSTTGNSGSTNALNSATTTIDVSVASAPTAGQVLTASSGTAAT